MTNRADCQFNKDASSYPAQAGHGQDTYVVCYRESCVRDVEICLKNPAEANPIGDEWMPVDSAKLFVGIFKADSETLAVEDAAKAEGCDKACLEAILVSKPMTGRLYHVYKKDPDKHPKARNIFRGKNPHLMLRHTTRV